MSTNSFWGIIIISLDERDIPTDLINKKIE